MLLSRQATIGAFAFAAVACHTDLAPPANAVIGQFGGRGIEIVATASRIRVRFPCSMAEFSRPLTPTPSGTFAVPPTLVLVREGTAAVALRGTATSDELALDAVWLSPTGETHVQHYAALRASAPDFGGFVCAAQNDA